MATTARLRKAFAYPSDDDEPSDLDEEHQEQLITDLATQDAATNTLYRNVYLSIPCFAALFSLWQLLFARRASSALIAILSLTSHLTAAYIVQYQPIRAPDRKGKKALYKIEAESGPLETYLIPLNAGLAGLLLLAAALNWRQGRVEDAWRQTLPALVFGLSLVVRWLLAPVDLEELKGAMYELKGA